jgi:outer membrane protein assembly factor BamB
MAILEVHHGQGRVERVTLARDQPLLFGSSPKADIVVDEEGIQPFHGRVRWREKSQSFKVDASPEAEFLVINGVRMASASFRQGDEIRVGETRIFLLNENEIPLGMPTTPARDDVTRVQPPPFMAPPMAGTVIARGSANKARKASAADEFDEFDEFDILDDEPVRAKTEKPRDRAPMPPVVRIEPPKGKSSRGWRRLIYLFSAKAYAPGQEEVFSSPLVVGLAGAFIALAVIGFALYGIIQRTAANRLFAQAVENLDDGDYRNAIRRFDEFLKSNPKDERADKARVHRAMANVRQYTAAASASWTLALEAEREMRETVGDLEPFRDSSSELDELVLRTGEALAERARITADPKLLAEAESTVSLHRQLKGEAAAALLQKSTLPDKLDAARAAVLKARVRAEAMAAMDKALKDSSSAGVYAARDALVASYSDQARDKDLLGRMNKANDLIRAAVKVDDSQRPAETEQVAEPLGPPLSLVLRSEDVPAAKAGPLVFALADGYAFAIDGSTGAPIWQKPVGLSSPFAPQPIPGGSSALVVDARHHELVRLETRTGNLIWRQSLDEPVTDPPLVLGNQVIQPLPSGKLLLIDLPSGGLRASVMLGRRLARSPVADEAGQALYLLAESDCLFVLARDPLACSAVEYLGHSAGSIGCTPARVGRYLIVAENQDLNDSRWRVFLIEEEGIKLSAVQDVPVQGWTWGTPATSGSVAWAVGDRGAIAARAVGAYGEKDPFRLIARTSADADPSGPAYALSRSERELLVASGRSGRYTLDPEGGKITPGWTLGEAGPALAPPQMAGPLLVLTQQNTEGQGVSLWGIEPEKGDVKWRTVLGSPWTSPPALGRTKDQLTSLGVEGRLLTLSHEALSKGGFLTSVLPKPASFRIPPAALIRLEGDGWTAVVPALNSTRVLVRADGADAFQEVGLPAPVGARPLAWGKELFLPGSDGRAYLLDPLSGESRAEPYVPPFDLARKSRWYDPVALGADAVVLADTAGRVRRLIRASDPRPRLVVSAETAIGGELAAEPVATTSAVIVVTAENRVRAFAARDLSAIGAWNLDAPLAAPPAMSGGRAFLADSAGNLLAIGEDGQRAWSSKLTGKGDTLAQIGAPSIYDDAVWLLARDGTLHVRELADGAAMANTTLGVLPSAGPIAVSKDLALPVGLGTFRLLRLDDPKPEPSKRADSKEDADAAK